MARLPLLVSLLVFATLLVNILALPLPRGFDQISAKRIQSSQYETTLTKSNIISNEVTSEAVIAEPPLHDVEAHAPPPLLNGEVPPESHQEATQLVQEQSPRLSDTEEGPVHAAPDVTSVPHPEAAVVLDSHRSTFPNPSISHESDSAPSPERTPEIHADIQQSSNSLGATLEQSHELAHHTTESDSPARPLSEVAKSEESYVSQSISSSTQQPQLSSSSDAETQHHPPNISPQDINDKQNDSVLESKASTPGLDPKDEEMFRCLHAISQLSRQDGALFTSQSLAAGRSCSVDSNDVFFSRVMK